MSFREPQTQFIVLAMFLMVLLALILGSSPVAAQIAPGSTADCKRFYLKLNKKTGKWECLYKVKKKKKNTEENKRANDRLKRQITDIENRIQKSQAIINQLTERQIKLRTDLLQLQKKFLQDLKSAQIKRTEALIRQSEELRRQQQSLTIDLLAEQKQRWADLQQQALNLRRQQIELGRQKRR